jgi:hypothetical protein
MVIFAYYKIMKLSLYPFRNNALPGGYAPLSPVDMHHMVDIHRRRPA